MKTLKSIISESNEALADAVSDKIDKLIKEKKHSYFLGMLSGALRMDGRVSIQRVSEMLDEALASNLKSLELPPPSYK